MNKEAGWNAPLLENKLDAQEVQLTMFIPKVHEQENVYDNVHDNVHDGLTEHQRIILDIIKFNDVIT